MGRVEEPLGGQPGLELLEGHIEVPHALGPQVADIELIGPVPGIDAHPPEGRDAHAALGAKAQLHRAALEHDAADGALAVL